MPLAKLFRRSRVRAAAHELYGAAVRQAREPGFYTRCGVADSLDGRFDMIVLHVFLLLRSLRRWGEPGTRPGQFCTVHKLAVDRDGYVYVADRENQRVQIFDSKGKYQDQVGVVLPRILAPQSA